MRNAKCEALVTFVTFAVADDDVAAVDWPNSYVHLVSVVATANTARTHTPSLMPRAYEAYAQSGRSLQSNAF